MVALRRTPTTRRRSPARLATALLAVAGLALTACSSSSSGPGGSAPKELKKITVVTFLPLESFSFTPEMVAKAGGYFEKHGLDVTLQPVQGTPAAIQSLLGGAALVTRASTVDVFPAMEQGQPIRAIGTMAYRSNIQMVSVKDDPIKSPKDMSGKTIGMGSIGGTSEKLLNLALDKANVKRDAVQRQAVPVTAATVQVVKQGQLDGYIVSYDTGQAIKQQDPDAVVDDAGLGTAPDIQTWLTTADSLKDPEKTAELTDFLAAIKEASQSVLDDADDDYANVLKTLRDSGDFDFPALQNDKVAQASLKTYTGSTWVKDPTPLLENDIALWKQTYDTYVTAGFLKGGQDPTQWITNDYLPK